MISLTFLSYITIKISDPALSVEDDHSSLVGNRGELVLLVSDVLKRDDLVLMDDGVVVPECLSVGQGSRVVIFHTEDLLFEVDYIRKSCTVKCVTDPVWFFRFGIIISSEHKYFRLIDLYRCAEA